MEITEGSSRSGKLIEGIKCIQAELLPSLTWQKRKTAVRCSDYTLQNPISGLFLFCFHFCFTKEPRFGSHDGFSGVLPEKTIRFLGGRPAYLRRKTAFLPDDGNRPPGGAFLSHLPAARERTGWIPRSRQSRRRSAADHREEFALNREPVPVCPPRFSAGAPFPQRPAAPPALPGGW